MTANRRQMLGQGVALGVGLIASKAFSQNSATGTDGKGGDRVSRRRATTTVLFHGPKGAFINGVASTSDGFWIVEQKINGGANSPWKYRNGQPLQIYSDLHETAWLVDDKGNIKSTAKTEGHNTSGFAYGGGYLWLGSNSAGQNGVVQASLEGKTIKNRQVPFGPPGDGGGIHGLDYVGGKLWIASLRLRALVKVDAASWNTELILPFPQQFARYHGCAYDASNDTVLVITGNESTGYSNGKAGIARLDAKTGALVEVIDFMPDTCDPHGLTFKGARLISCDAGLHPGWPLNDSPYSGAIFQINIV